ncbi:hypothetical protein BAE44_0002277 [Dichanthelium oligosanthes]|uniref:C2H2-type domain-containing protein n=1 Tax=Dichanthelium oligosanthes TaxID=888268 RepID=A0A1E5WH31_9POAL|nr:hypothetical protein BAE44_0002277 [Dichanthelium oligosanthes]
MDSPSRRRPLRDLDGGDDLEEGEYVPGRRHESSDTDDDDDVYRFQTRGEGEVHQEHGRRMSLLEEVMASDRVAVPRSQLASGGIAPPSLTPSCESDGTISDDGNPSASSVISVGPRLPARRFACHVCGRSFISPKAVDGHMRVHGSGRLAAVVGWASTGKRGWTGGKPSVALSLNSESTDNSTAIVAVHPLETNLSGKESSSAASAEPMQYEPVATLVTGANPSSIGAVVHQPAAPPPAAEHARPVHQPTVPPPAAQQAQFVQQPLVAPPARAAPPPREYTCKLCGKSYATHQGLGGHAAGHRNRQKEAEAAAAAAGMMAQDGSAFLAAFRRGRRAEEPHECQKCHKVFPSGVALGGHMRMHYTGPPIVHKKSKKRCLALLPGSAVSEADLRLALSTITEPAPAVAGRVRLFGIDIGPNVQAPSEQQGSGAAEGSSSAGAQQQGSATAEDSSSAGEQQ